MLRCTTSSKSMATLPSFSLHQLHQVDQVGAVELGGLGRQAARRIGVTDHTLTPLSVTCSSPGTVYSQLPPAWAAMSTMTEPGFMLSTISLVISLVPACRDQGGSDDDVHFLGLLGEQLHLGLDELFAHHLGVTVAGCAIFAAEVQLEEFPTHGLDLLGDFQTGIEGTHDGTEEPAVPMAARPATPAPMTSTWRAALYRRR